MLNVSNKTTTLMFDTSVGTISMAYSVDIPRCWCDHVSVVQMITLMQQVEISVQCLCLLWYF